MGFEDIDPSIAALLTEESGSDNSISYDSGDSLFSFMGESDKKDFSEFVEERKESADKPKMLGCVPEVDLNIREFRPITKFFNDEPSKVYDDPVYYKKVLTGEGQSSQRLHGLLVKYLNCQDKKDRTVYRQQIITAYWEFLRNLAPKMASTGVADCKRMAMRFGIVLPSLATPEQKEMFARSIDKNVTYEPVLYMDEWIRSVALGHMKPSTTDETPVKGVNKGGAETEQQRLQQLKSKNSGKIQTSESLLNAKESERQTLELQVQNRLQDLFAHETIMGFEPHRAPYTELQRKMFSDITNLFRQLQKVDKELANYLNEYKEAKSIEESLNSKQSEVVEEVSVGKEEILGEMNTIRQMAKMTCGRQGNQYPVFTREFFHCIDNGTGFRENVIRELA